MMLDWAKLKPAFITHFPKLVKKDKKKTALTALFALKRKGRSLDDYFTEIREINDGMPKEIAEDITERVIEGLDRNRRHSPYSISSSTQNSLLLCVLCSRVF